MFDVEPGEHKINLLISKIYNENVLKNDPVTLSSPILINSFELIGHNWFHQIKSINHLFYIARVLIFTEGSLYDSHT